MSGIAEPPVKTETPPAAPGAAPAAPIQHRHLPTGVSVDNRHDATEFFEKHKAANSVQQQPPAPPPTETGKPTPPPAAPAPQDQAPPPAAPPEKKSDLGAQLTEQFLPESARKTVEAPPEPPPAPTGDNPEDKIVLDPKYSAPAHESFRAVKAVTKTEREGRVRAEGRIKELESEVEKLRTGAVTVESPEIVKLRAEHKSMSDRLVVLDLENHPNFQREFTAPRLAAEQEARNILEAAGVTGVDLNAVLSKDAVSFRKELSAIAAKLPTGLDQTDFAQQMRTAHTLRHRASEAMSKAGEISTALRQQTLNGHKAAFDETFSSTIVSLRLQELKAPTGASPEQIAEVEAFNQGVKGIRANAEKIALGTSDPKSIAGASIRAAAYEFQVRHVMPMMSKVIAGKDARIAELEGKLKAVAERNPNRDLRGSPHGPGGVDPSKMDHHEAAEYYAGLGKGGG